MNATLNKQFWALVNTHKLNADEKDGLVWDYTHGRTHHSKELTDEEARGLIKSIQARFNTQKNIPDSLRKQLIAMSYSIGENPEFISSWCEKYGAYGVKKKFNEYSSNELIALREKFKKVVRDRQAAVTKK